MEESQGERKRRPEEARGGRMRAEEPDESR